MRAREFVRACVRACVRARACVCVCVCVLGLDLLYTLNGFIFLENDHDLWVMQQFKVYFPKHLKYDSVKRLKFCVL